MRKIISVKALTDHILEIKFDNERSCEIDFQKKISKGGVYAHLKDINSFSKVSISKNGRYIHWDDNIELCADALWYEGTNEKIQFKNREAS